MAKFLIVVNEEYVRDAQYRICPSKEDYSDDLHDDAFWRDVQGSIIVYHLDAKSKEDAIKLAAKYRDDDPKIFSAHELVAEDSTKDIEHIGNLFCLCPVCSSTRFTARGWTMKKIWSWLRNLFVFKKKSINQIENVRFGLCKKR